MPWPGFFHKWFMSDVFIILDTVQFHKNEWQNRNRIKTVQGAQWITVPVNYRFPQTIDEVTIAGDHWVKKQIASIEQAYAKATFFEQYWPEIKAVLQQPHTQLATLNTEIIRTLGKTLGCKAPLYLASELDISETDPTNRLIEITKTFDGTRYLSGSEGRNYLEKQIFFDEEVELVFQSVTAPEYHQLHGTFIPYLSVLDVLLNMGEDTIEIITKMGGVVEA